MYLLAAGADKEVFFKSQVKEFTYGTSLFDCILLSLVRCVILLLVPNLNFKHRPRTKLLMMLIIGFSTIYLIIKSAFYKDFGSQWMDYIILLSLFLGWIEYFIFFTLSKKQSHSNNNNDAFSVNNSVHETVPLLQNSQTPTRTTDTTRISITKKPPNVPNINIAAIINSNPQHTPPQQKYNNQDVDEQSEGEEDDRFFDTLSENKRNNPGYTSPQDRPAIIATSPEKPPTTTNNTSTDVDAGVYIRKHPYSEKTEQSLEKLINDAKGTEDEGWKFEKELNEVKITKKEVMINNLSVTMIRGQGIIPRSAETTFELIKATDRRTEWDEMYVGGKDIEEYDPRTRVSHLMFSGMYGVSGRDTCVLTSYKKLSDGSIAVCAFSIVHPSCPLQKSYVRAEIFNSGFYLEPLQDEPNSCYVTYIVCWDAKGWIPKSLLSIAQTKQPMCVANMRKCLLKSSEIINI